jgi:dipeptidyl aminopeptidase/acylaminoacyl peptidase
VPRVFLAADNAIWLISSQGEARRVFDPGASASLLAIAPSPGADQVAALVENNVRDLPRYEVLIIGDDGRVVSRLENQVVSPATPSPVDGELASIDWSPQGDRVLVAFRSGEILVSSLKDTEQPIVLDALGDASQIIEPAWSPTGESIAFIAVGDGRVRSLRAITLDDEKIEVIIPAANGRMPIDFVWMPDGVSLLFTEGGQPGSPNSGIDLWRVNAEGAERRLVASAGTVAPIARVTEPRPSPDGKSVAYAVLVPGEAGPEADSIWVRDLTSNIGFRIEIPSLVAVSDLFWTDNGLLVAAEAPSSASRATVPELLRVNDNATTVVLWAAPVAVSTPVAGTPIASPVSR